MYQLEKSTFKNQVLLRIRHTITGEYFEVLPDYGATLQALFLRKNNRLYDLIEGYKDETELTDNQSFKSSHLIPFPNRIDQGLYSFGENTYRLTPNFEAENNAIHGLIYRQKFEAIFEQDNDSASIILQYQFKGEAGFPFPFLTKIRYTLRENTLTCDLSVHNNGTREIPLGIGWHPYFKLGTNTVDELLLKLPLGRMIRTNERMIPTGELTDYELFKSLHPIHEMKFDTGFFLDNTAEAITTIYNKKMDVNLMIRQENCPYLQVYIPPNRQSIAIEPMTCAANAFNNGMGLEILPPQGVHPVFYALQLT